MLKIFKFKTKNSEEHEFKDAIGKGDIKRIQLMINATPALANMKDSDGRTVLHNVMDTSGMDIFDRGNYPALCSETYIDDVVTILLPNMDSETISAIDKKGKSALHYAATIFGDKEWIVAKILQSKPELARVIDKIGKTALHYAAEFSHEKAVRILIQYNARIINLTDNEGKTALHYAVEAYNPMGIVEILLQYKPELIDIVDAEGKTVLHYAVHYASEKMIRMLLEHKAKLIDIVDNVGQTILHAAAWGGNEKVIEIVLQYKPDLLDALDNEGKNVLYYAARNGKKNAVDMLLRLKPELIDGVANDGSTILHGAPWYGREEILEVLLRLKPKMIDAVTKDGSTVLHYAATGGGNYMIMNMLLQLKPKMMNAITKDGSTILHKAVTNPFNIGAVERLLQLKPEMIDAVTEDGSTVLHTAALAGNEEAVKILIQQKPKLISDITKEGNTVLHYAAWAGKKEVVKVLIQQKPSLIKVTNNDGETALDLATGEGHGDIIVLLANNDVNKLITSIKQLCNSKVDSEEQLKILRISEGREMNVLEEESQMLPYSREKIYNLLSIQLRSKKDIIIELFEIQNAAKNFISEKRVLIFLNQVIKENKIFVLGLHLHCETWTGLVLKSNGENNLQLIYNDPMGDAFTKEPAVQKLINFLTEQHYGDTNIIDLRKVQCNIQANSGAFVVDNLVKLAVCPSFKKADLQKLLAGVRTVNKLKAKHVLFEQTLDEEHNLDYSRSKFEKIMELYLKDKPSNLAPISIFEDKVLLMHNAKEAAQQVIYNGMTVIMPLSTRSGYWSGLVIKKQPDESLQIIYSNPTGKTLGVEKNAMSLIESIMKISSEIHIFDIAYKQSSSKQSSGPYSIDNLTKLALNDTDNFHKKDFQELLSTSISIEELEKQHTKLIHDYLFNASIVESDPSYEMNRGHEAFEGKENYPDGEEKHMWHPMPLPYAGDVSLSVHISGNAMNHPIEDMV